MPKISCVIPAYNEEGRIGKVLETVASHPLIDEIIVVDDGSAAGTLKVIQEFAGKFAKIRPIAVQPNAGKTSAMHRGFNEASGDLLLFLDSDLIGLEQQNITDLIEPVVSGHVDVSISLRKNAPGLWRWIGIDYISGERV